MLLQLLFKLQDKLQKNCEKLLEVRLRPSLVSGLSFANWNVVDRSQNVLEQASEGPNQIVFLLIKVNIIQNYWLKHTVTINYYMKYVFLMAPIIGNSEGDLKGLMPRWEYGEYRIWLSGRRARRVGSVTSGMTAEHWHMAGEWLAQMCEWGKTKKGNKRRKQSFLKMGILKSLPSAACWIRPVAAALSLLFSLIDGTALLLTFPQEHFTCSVLIGPRPSSLGSES